MTTKMISDQQQGDLDGVVEEEVQGLGQPVVRRHPQPVVQQRSQSQPLTQYSATHTAAAPDRVSSGRGGGRHSFDDVMSAPTRRDAAGVRLGAVECVAGERVVDPPAAAAGGHQSRVAQHLEVVAEQVRGDRNVLLQLADAGLPGLN